jgi:hypothetical protein
MNKRAKRIPGGMTMETPTEEVNDDKTLIKSNSENGMCQMKCSPNKGNM